MDYDVVIIGAGMSGLAAGIRLAHFGRRVLILERHRLVGGLNSYYRRGGREFDVGLHAMTNFPDPQARSAPLNKLLRQLRLRLDDLDLCEQTCSTVRFPGAELRFTNRFPDLEASVAAAFPDQIDGFRKLVACIRAHDSLSLTAQPAPTRPVLRQFISNPLLEDMILCPLMYYGNAEPHDMEFNQFCIMFQSIFLEGFCRPRRGIRHLLDLLLNRYRESGGELRTGCGVRSICTQAGAVSELVLDDGATLRPAAVMSCAGYVETLQLCEPPPADAHNHAVGELAFVESIFVLDRPAADLGFGICITFFNDAERFVYARATEPVDYRSGVLCVPGNFAGMDAGTGESIVRLTHQADHGAWMALGEDEYRGAKQQVLARQQATLDRQFPGFASHVVATDMFTPRTILRYTGHLNGTVYGSPAKRRDGTTPVRNLFICGTDQGFLGIVGSMLSGVSMANYHLMK
ncbi:MAG: hypothetical protein A3K19_32725 [Lentisphaerae bacterium RIFOXYB12_FULL_65_16]|nr:MAG: hypothetical protein A3K18_20510 [Lentisphaerae bacterium RIFOXYA12_64_32]OGV84508.1 MAG: hypothetical protein A3K19_32725 [Lentisphaerae bacterium RIFOXYB12_FULL_65_16]